MECPRDATPLLPETADAGLACAACGGRYQPLRRLGLVLVLLFCAAPLAAQVNKWVDDKGKVHYGDRPPPGARTETVTARISSYTGEAVVSDLDTPRARAVSPGRVVMFSAPWCKVCTRAKAWLQAHGVAFEEYDIEADPANRREFEALGGKGVPLMLVAGKRVEGFSARTFERLLLPAKR